MLGGRISNADEEEVEEELAALEAAAAAAAVVVRAPLPNVPETELPQRPLEEEQEGQQPEPIRQADRTPMLAA